MHIIGFFLILVLAVVLIVLSLVFSLLRALFGRRRAGGPTFYSHTGSSSRPSGGDGFSSTSAASGSATQSRKKIFADDEGEYVDFEEVREEERGVDK